MASIKYTAFVNEIKGKIAGTVFQGSYAGTIVKTKPSNTKRIFDAIQQGSLGAVVINAPRTINMLSTQWKNLSDADRLSWSSAAVNFPFKNRFGETYIASGFQVYMSLNSALVNVGREKMSIAPTPEVLPQTPDFYMDNLAFPAFSMVLTDPFPANCKLVLSASKFFPLNTTPSIAKMKAIKIIDNLAVFPLDVTDDYVAARGTIPASGNITFKLVAVNLINGQVGAPIYKTYGF